MAIELHNESVSAYGGYSGSGTVIIPAGKILKIETAPQGEEILEAEVPAGKTWTVSISINIVES